MYVCTMVKKGSKSKSNGENPEDHISGPNHSRRKKSLKDDLETGSKEDRIVADSPKKKQRLSKLSKLGKSEKPRNDDISCNDLHSKNSSTKKDIKHGKRLHEETEKAVSEKKHKRSHCDLQQDSPDEPKSKKSKQQKRKTKVKPSDDDDDNSAETVQELTPEEKAAKKKKREKMKTKKDAKKKQKDDQKKQIEASLTPGNVGTAQKEALDYLTLWRDERGAWKFNKVRQIWLLQHMYDSNKVSDDEFAIVLEYLEGMLGKSRDTTKQKAEGIIADLDDSDSSDEEDSTVETKLVRARQIMQML